MKPKLKGRLLRVLEPAFDTLFDVLAEIRRCDEEGDSRQDCNNTLATVADRIAQAQARLVDDLREFPARRRDPAAQTNV